MLWVKQVPCALRLFCNKLSPKSITKHMLQRECSSVKEVKHIPRAGILQLQKNTHLLNLFNTDNPSEELFQQLRESCLECNVVNKQNLDSIIFRQFLALDKEETAISYVSFLRNHNYPLNTGFMTVYIKSLGLLRRPLLKTEEKEIIEYYEKVKKEGLTLIPNVREALIIALSTTSRWNEAIDLLGNVSTEILSHLGYNAIVNATFKHGKMDIGMKYLQQIPRFYSDFDYTSLFIEYINHYANKNQSEFDKAMDRMFSFWMRFNIFPNEVTVNMYMETCKTFGWEVEHATMSNDGICSVCQKCLTRQLSINDFEKLRKCMTSEKVFESNVYGTTTPKELQHFKWFVSKTAPYDIVIDGLNVMYFSSSYNVKKTAFHFINQNKKVLIIGRKHMRNLLQEWKSNVFHYMLDNLSKDDTFLLYAVFASGHNTKFVSSDLMRQHRYKLSDFNMELLFDRWQWSHQYTLLKNGSKSIIKEPLGYEPYTQKNDNTWHIPYGKDTKDLTPPEKWICCTRENKGS